MYLRQHVEFSNTNQNIDNVSETTGKFLDQSCAPSYPISSNLGPDLSTNSDGKSAEDCDVSNLVLKYISQILMEEDMEEKTEMYHEPAALEAAEQSVYELLGKKHSLSPPCDMTSYADQNNEGRDECHPSRSDRV